MTRSSTLAGASALSLEDKYALGRGRVYLTGVQALVRLTLMQADRDRAAGLATAGFVSGYRGSPLGALDRALVEAEPHLSAHGIRFQPGVNEELAATAVWGTQQLHLFPRPRHDGVFAMWYGKGPGVDRCADVFKHANYAGTSRHGGVLVVGGDDHSAKSSAVAHQSEHQFSAAAIPVLAPADLQEVLDYGLHGWAMSRYSGCWVALKLAGEVAESSGTVEVDPARVAARLPESFPLPPDGVSLRWPDPPLAQERRMQEYKVYAALAYARANGLDRTVIDSPCARFGILTCGKAYRDVLQALEDLGIDEREAARAGIRLYKAGLVWPLEAEGVRRFAAGLEEILVVEEKRQLLEYQLKEQLYNWRGWRVRDDPLLWTLHLGYTWLVVALGLRAVAAPGDLADLVRIDRNLMGRERRAYIEGLVAEALDDSAVRVSLTARVDGIVAGFAMARTDFGDFGRSEPVAVLDTIGIDPDYAHLHVATALLSQLFVNLEALRIERVETLVRRENFDLLGFLYSIGFRQSQRLGFMKAFA